MKTKCACPRATIHESANRTNDNKHNNASNRNTSDNDTSNDSSVGNTSNNKGSWRPPSGSSSMY